MADVITRLKIESGEYDSKIKRAVSGLQNMEQECRRVNGTLAKLEQDQKQYVQSLGQMQTVSNTVRGKIGELSGAFVELRAQYNRLTEEEKRGDYGKALSKSLDDLKNRIRDSKKELSDIQQELNGGASKFGDFGKVIDTVGNRLGVSGSLTEMLTSKTAMLTAGVGAGIAIVGEATKAWMSYNAELAKQDQITKVTTGLEGPDSNRLTDAARAMADVYKVDFREAINAANTLMTQFGKTGDEAIQLLRDGMQGMVMGDGQKLLSMIQQYAPAFRDAGISASQLVAIIQNSEGGIFTDQNMNAIVMGIKNIRLMTNQTSEALAKLGIDGQDMTKKLNDGTMTIFDALKQVMGALQNVGSGSQAAGEVMQTVFGRQGVSAGTNLAKAIESLNTNLQETKRQTGEVGEAYDDLLRSTEKLNTAIREAFGYNGWEEMATGIKSKLITALADVLTLLNKIRDYDMPDWLKGPGDKPKPYIGTKVDTDYITRGTSAADREKRYTTVTGNINKKLQNLNAQEAALGKPYTYTDKNGGLVEQIDTPEEVAQKRRQIQSSRQILTRRLNTIQSQHDTLTAEPVRANTTQPKTGGTGGGTGGGRSLSAPEQADAKYVQAQKDYEQSLQQAALEVKAGTINSAEAKKKELQAAETLWKSIGDAREVYDSPKLKEAQANVEAKIVALGPEVDKAIEAQKAVEKASRELEMANKKAADARAKLADAEATGELKKILPAQKAVTEANREVTRKETVLHELQEKTVKVNVEQGSVNLPKVPTDDETIKVNVEQGSVNLLKVPTDDQTIKVNVEEGSVNLPEIPTDDETIKVNVEQGEVNLPEIPTDNETIKVNVEQGSVNLPKVPTDDETIKVNVEQGSVNLPKVPTDDETIKVNVEQGSVNLPKVPTDDETIKVNVEQGSVNLPEIPTDDETIKVNVEQGSVNLPEIPTDDETIKVNVEQGSVNLPEIPTDDETIKVNVEQGEVNLPKVPTDDETIKVNVEQGSVNLPKVPTDDETIKVNVEQGEVNLPEIPTDNETIKVNVEQGSVNLPKVPTDDETIKVNVEQGEVNLPEIPTDDETIKVNAETGDVSLPEIPEEKTIKVDAVPGDVKLPEVKEKVQIPVTLSNLDAIKQKMTEEMATTPVGDSLLQNMQEAFSDASAIGSIFSTAVKNGIDTATFDTSGIMQKLLNGEDIPDETIQGFVQTLNEKLVEAFGEDGAMKLKVVFDVDDKQIKNLGKKTTEDAEKTQKAWGLAASSVNNLGNALASIEDPGAKAAGTVIKAIADIALGFANASKTASSLGPWGWLAWMAAGTAAMATTISTVHSLTGFAEGGEVKGNTYSGDQIPAMLNAGEVVLNRAQVGNLAEQLEDNDNISGFGGTPYVTGEQIYLGLNNYLKGAGLGQIVISQ